MNENDLLIRPLLILDLDETLVYATEKPLARAADFRTGCYYVYKRPHLETFLTAAAAVFGLAVWSAGTIGYVESIVWRIGRDLPLSFVFSRKQCTRCFDHETQEEYFLKDLKKVKRRGFDLDRVLIAEDDPRQVRRHYGNAVYVKPFVGDEGDVELPLLAAYLVSISAVPNFRKLEKRGWRLAA